MMNKKIGHIEDKKQILSGTEQMSEKVNAPIIQELPMSLECKVKSFEDGMKLK